MVGAVSENPQATWYDAVRPQRRIGGAIEVHETIASTNDRARELLDLPEGDGCVVVAEEQSAGRGRRGRTWTSPPGHNLTASVGIRPRLRARDGWQIGLAAALAARDACSGLVPVALKWPNDLMDAGDGRKVGGMLVETVVEGDRLSAAVIGIGINVNWRRDDMPPELVDGATSLIELVGSEVDRVGLLRRLLEALDLEIMLVEAGRSPRDRYRAACSTIGATVTVDAAGGMIEGRAIDIDALGSLVVETAAGKISVTSGEVASVRRVVTA